MADIMRTSLSGLLAFQRALATTSNNVANANTEGYSRQRVEIVSRKPEGFGNGFVGAGVDVRTITRSYDQFAINQYRSSSSLLGRLDAYSGIASQVDNILGDSSNGLANGINSFFSAWQDVANSPSSITARQLLLTQAQSLGDQFRLTGRRLDQLEVDINQRLQTGIADINRLTESIARLNEDIEIAMGSFNGQPPNDLLDQRDQLVSDLARIIDVQVLQDSNGALNVYIGSGQNVVLRHPHKIHIGDNVVVDDNCLLDAKGESNTGIRIGSRVFVGRNTILSCKNGDIELADDANIGFNCEVFSASRVSVGRGALLAAYSYLIGGDHDFSDPTVSVLEQARKSDGISVGDGAWIGAGAKVLDGVVIGDKAVIGAGAVVTSSIPAQAVAVGVPARVVSNR